MKKFKNRVIGGVLVFSLSGVLAACADEPQEGEEDAGADDAEENGAEEDEDEDEEGDEATSEGGDMVLAMGSDAVDLDPHGSNDTSSTHIRSNLYDKLVDYDENMELEPDLAEDYEQIDDNTWEFNLKEDVTFHDGEPFDADDVVATLERVIDPDFASEKAFLYEMIEEIEAVDEHTVQITTEYPFAPLDAHLAHDGGGMMSAAAIEEDENDERNLDTEPVGTGPFELENWDQGNEVVLTRNDDYHGGEIALDSATYTVVDEQLTRIGMLENNEAHVADDIEPSQMDQLEEMEGVDVSSVESLRLDYVGMNNEEEPFDDPDVRRAINMAVDKETIIEGVYEGYGEEAIGALNPLVFGYSEDIEPVDYDVDEAESLMDDAGYEDGFETTLLVEDVDQVNLQIAEILQQQLAEIGVDMSIEQQEWGALLDATAEGSYEMVMLGWTTVTGDADYAMYPLFHSDSHGAPGNRTFYDNEEVDELLDAGRETADDDERIEIYSEAQQIINDEATVVPLVHDDFRAGVHESVEGFIHYPDAQFDLRDVELVDDEVDGGGY
ncbi:glutathione ABC transporter substrate-binding protein [Natribacillus halophilus]|uniref:Peptide/nickel transport system substrate-binding protein n=1 Tax=Natribacillus halophilus TaxID=549003 RepID=A0A1G8QIN3_9BACI|nr:glutathione ABC transporter substrate-binding protein [Natribacillus halophilus]SDJ03950.1 peptide/nickel transport system substrate-binding protein [Natribacillus halophilus]